MERRRSSRHSNNDNHGQSNSASGASGSHHSTSGSSHQLSNGSGSDGAEDGEASSSFSKHGNGGDNSSSDSADAASAALTQRRAHVGDRVATRRSGQHLAHVKGSSTLVPTREGSPPENDSASGDSNNGSNDATQSNGGTGSAASNEQKRAGSGGSGGGGSGSNSDENASGDSPPHESASVPGLPQQGPVSAAPPLPVAPINPVGMVQQGVVGVLPTAGAQGVPPTSTQGLLEHLPPHLQQMLHRLPPANQSMFAQAASASLLPAQGIHAYGGAQGNGGNGVLQGVLPFPGQGVVELQQGVIVGGALEEFRGQATQQNALAAHQQGVLGGDGTAIPFQMPQAQHAMPRVAPIASATVARSEDNGFTGEPPAKRAAASTLDASGMVVDGAEEPAKGVTAPRHTRAEFGCEGGGTATAAQPAPTAMDESR